MFVLTSLLFTLRRPIDVSLLHPDLLPRLQLFDEHRILCKDIIHNLLALALVLLGYSSLERSTIPLPD
jgi:hypothetical protein